MKIVTGIILTSVAAFSGAAYAADAQPTTGNAEVTLEHVHAVMENGSPAPQHDAACKRTFHAGIEIYGHEGQNRLHHQQQHHN